MRCYRTYIYRRLTLFLGQDGLTAYLLTTALRMVEVQSVLEHTDTDEEENFVSN